MRELPVVEGVKLESKLTSGFPAMTATVQVHKRSRRNGLLTWIVKAITVAALNYGMREALDLFKDWIRGLLQRSLGNGGARQENARAISGPSPDKAQPGGHATQVVGRGVD